MNTPERKNSDRKQRRHFTPPQKVAIVKRHLVDGIAVSDLCDEHQIQPTQLYQWQKQLFENGEAAFERKGKPAGKSLPDCQPPGPSPGCRPLWTLTGQPRHR